MTPFVETPPVDIDIETPLPPRMAFMSTRSSTVRKWKAQALERLPSLFSDEHQAVRELEVAYERERQELYAEIGRLTTQLAWLKKKSGFNLVEK